jgi:hypothetical protein
MVLNARLTLHALLMGERLHFFQGPLSFVYCLVYHVVGPNPREGWLC